MSARHIIDQPPMDVELDPNLAKHRAALFEAMRIDRLPKRQRVEAIAHLILGHVIQDPNRVAFSAHIAALANGGRN